jgi:lysophospholipase L1-like esterase
MLKKEWLVALSSTIITVLVAVGLIRWLAPGLLGVPRDLQLVSVSKEVPPFYDGVFRDADYESKEFILRDPLLVNRAHPLFDDQYLMGPNDILGFRNRAVPNEADIITIGDSQTYGNNAPLEENWPSRLAAHLPNRAPIIYNMSCGGWDGVQYLDIAKVALRFHPRVIVVAFYAGNDPRAGFALAYGSDHWADLRIDPTLTARDAPPIAWPAPPSDQWAVRFKDGSRTVFTPKLRLSSNLPDHVAIKTAWRILQEVAARITTHARDAKVPVLFTVIPTKELVHAQRIAAEGIEATDDYRTLVASELRYIADFGATVRGFPGASYVDVVTPMQEAALKSMLYRGSTDGHPSPAGYDVLAATISAALAPYIPVRMKGLFVVRYANDQTLLILAKDNGYFTFASLERALQNGWDNEQEVDVLVPRDIAGLPYLGTISTVDPLRFGPGGA